MRTGIAYCKLAAWLVPQVSNIEFAKLVYISSKEILSVAIEVGLSSISVFSFLATLL
jgi:hypothetical protein